MEFPQTVLDSISGTKQDTHTVDVVSGGWEAQIATKLQQYII